MGKWRDYILSLDTEEERKKKEEEEREEKRNAGSSSLSDYQHWKRTGELPEGTKRIEEEEEAQTAAASTPLIDRLAARGITVELPEPKRETAKAEDNRLTLAEAASQGKTSSLFTDRLGSTFTAARAQRDKLAAQAEEERKDQTVRNPEWLDALRSPEEIQAELDEENAKVKEYDRQAFQNNALGVWRDLIGQNAKTDAENQRISAERKAHDERKAALEDELAERRWADYERLRNNADFEAKSQYKSTENGKETVYNPLMDTYDSIGFDPEYEFINGSKFGKEAQTILSNEKRNLQQDSGGPFAPVPDDYEFTHLSEMKEDEKALYNYIYATDGPNAAHEYLNYLRSDLYARQMEKEKDEAAAYAEKHPVMSTVGSIAMSPLRGWAYVGQAADYLTSGKIDQNAPYNRIAALPKAEREVVTRNVERNWGKAGSFAYGVGVSMAEFLLNSAVTGAALAGKGTAAGKIAENLSLALMGTGAAADATIEAKERGLSDRQSFALGTIAGAAEIITERISIEKLFSDPGGRPMKYLLQNILAEGSEEAASDVINLVADVLVSQDKSEWMESIRNYQKDGMTENEAFIQSVKDQGKQILYDAAAGALSGGIMAMPGTARGFAQLSQDRSQRIEAGRQAVQAKRSQEQENEGRIVLPTAEEATDTGDVIRTGTESDSMSPLRTADEAEVDERVAKARNITEATGIRYGVDQKEIRRAERLSRITGQEVEFYSHEAENGVVENGHMDPVTGKIWLNAKGKNPLQVTLGHEFTHSLEGTDAYRDLVDLAKTQTAESGGDWAAKADRYARLYEAHGDRVSDEMLDQELTADFVGETLFTDERAIREMFRENPSLGKRVRDAIDNFIVRASDMGGIMSPVDEQKFKNILKIYDRYVREMKRDEAAQEAREDAQAGETAQTGNRQGEVQIPQETTREAQLRARPWRTGYQTESEKAAAGYGPIEQKSGQPVPEVFAAETETVPAGNGQAAQGNAQSAETVSGMIVPESAEESPAEYRARMDALYDAGEITGEEYDEAMELAEEAENVGGFSSSTVARDEGPRGKLGELADRVRGRYSLTPQEAQNYDGREAVPSAETEDGEVLTETLRGGTQARYSLTSWSNTDKDAVMKNLVDAGYSWDDAQAYIDNVNSIAAIIAGDRGRLDYDAADNQVFMKPNAEYVITLDASTLCAKRLTYQGTFNKIQHALGNRVLMPEDLIDLANMMAEDGYQTPCGICYVESRRRHLGKFASQWLETYSGEYNPNLDEVTTTDGLEKLRHEHPSTYKDFVDAMNKKGTMNPKVVQLRTDYRGDINKLTKGKIEKIKRIGGVRVQSFSDFETPHLIDMMQAILDMSAKKLPAQAYTKVPNFAWAFGDTGIKINLSLIGGIDADGNLTFSSTEGMDFGEAMRLRDRYSENVGTILVGMNDAHILAAMADPRIDYIIPFHKSGWSAEELEKMVTLRGFEDYTDQQNEKKITGRKKNGGYETEAVEGGNFFPEDYWDYNVSGRENAERYLDLCAREGRLPKFYKFLVDNGDGSFSLQPDGSTDGYWKTLIDYKMYDNEGNGAPQRAVTPDFNMEECERILSEYEGGANELPSASDDFIDRYVQHYEEVHGESEKRYSISPEEDEAYMDAVRNGDEATQNEMVRDAAERAGYKKALFHGTGEYFNVFRRGGEGIHLGNRDVAEQVARNRYSNRSKETEYKWNDIQRDLDSLDATARRSLADKVYVLQDYFDGSNEFPYEGDLMDTESLRNYLDTIMNRYKEAYRDDNPTLRMATYDRQVGERVMNLYAKINNPMVVNGDLTEWTPYRIASMILAKAEGQDTLNMLYADGIDLTGFDADLTDVQKNLLRSVMDNYSKDTEELRWDILAKVIGEMGYDSIQYLNQYEGDKNNWSYIALRPADVKSADPVTYDDDGNVIPLSQRFNSGADDIRYSLGEDSTNVLSRSLNEYPEKKREQIQEYLDSVDDRVLNFIDESQQRIKKYPRYITTGQVSERLGADMKRLTGIDMTGEECRLSRERIRHIEKDHGKNGTTDHSMEYNEDLSRIQYVLDNYDNVELGGWLSSTIMNRNNTQAQTVVISKKIDGTFYVVEAVPDAKDRRLEALTAYIKKGDGSVADANAPSHTSKTTVPHSPGFSISDSGADVNGDEERFSLSAEKRIGEGPEDDTDSWYFKNWFGDYVNDPENASKVVNPDGTPKRMYHGTNADKEFTLFDTYGANYGLYGAGSYFTDNPDVAQSYTNKGRGKNPRVYEVYLNIRNPIVMEQEADVDRWLNALPELADYITVPGDSELAAVTNRDFYRAMEEYLADQGLTKWEAAEDAMDTLKAMGYDGINHVGGLARGDVQHDVWIAFDPEQIKSATDNIGTYDPNDPDIRYSLSEEQGPIANLPTSRARDEAIRIEGRLAASMARIFGMNTNHTSQEFRQFRAEVVRPIIDAMIEGREDIDPDAIFSEHWNGDLLAGQQARDEFDDAMTQAWRSVQQLNTFAERQRQETAAREQRNAAIDARIPQDTEGIIRLGENLKHARRERQRVLGRLLLTPDDMELVRAVAAGQVTDEQVYAQRPFNYQDILDAAAAERAFREQDEAWGRYTRRLSERRIETADRLLEDADKWKDKGNGFAYARETAERNFRDVMGSDAAAMIDEYIRPVHRSEAESTRFKNEYIKRVKDLKLDQKARRGNAVSEAAAVQWLGEAEDNVRYLQTMRNPDAVRDGQTLSEWLSAIEQFRAENPNLDYNKVYLGIREFSKIYDELITEMNRVLAENGYLPVNVRRGYFPHFNGGDDGILAKFASLLGINIDTNALPTAINGLTSGFKPGKAWFGHAQERTGFRTDYDAVQGFDGYIGGVSDVIHQTANIRNLRTLASRIRYQFSDEGIKNRIDEIMADESRTVEEREAAIRDLTENGRYKNARLVNWLDEYTNLLANKKSKYDRGIEDLMGRRVYTWMKNIEGRIAANMIAGNLGSALTNFIPLNQAGAMLGDFSMLRGAFDTMVGRGRKDDFVGQSDFLTNRRGTDPLIRNRADRISEFLSSPMNLIDNFTSEAIVRAAYGKYIRQGMDAESAMQAADEFAAGVMADRSKGAQPTVFGSRNPLMKLFTQFQVEVNNEFSTIFKDIPKGVYIPDREKKNMVAVAAWTLLRYFVGAYLFNDLYEKIVGRRAALDPIDILNDAVGDLSGKKLNNVFDMISDGVVDDVRRQNPSDVTQEFVTNVAEELPFVGGLLGGGRIPISSAFPDFENINKAAFSENWSGAKKAQVIGRELGGSVGTYILPPFAGGAIRKGVQTAENALAGGRYVKDKEGNDQLQYPYYTDTPLDTARTVAGSLLFGPTATEGGRDWVEGGFVSQSAKNTELYKRLTQDLGEDQRTSFAFISGLTGLDPLGKRVAVAESGLSEEGKAEAMSAVVSESERYKFRAAYENGVSADAWAGFYRTLPRYDEDGNGSYKQAEVTAALDNARIPLSAGEGAAQGLFGGDTETRSLTRAEKAAIWSAYNPKWKTANNPFDASIGDRVVSRIGQMQDEEGE